jgi:23S rRNA pseudouridine1911/1915/1917 synthase
LAGEIRVDGKKAAKGKLLRGGETILLAKPALEKSFAVSPNPSLELDVLYLDDFLFAVDKTAGLPCHPLRSQERRTVANAVVARFPEQAELEPRREVGLVHRLDNETGGVLLFARSPEALERLRGLSQGGKMKKSYLAWVHGCLSGKGKIDWPIGHHSKNPKKMCVATSKAEAERLRARPARTEYESLETGTEASLLRLVIRSGSRHQIRVHLAALGHPIFGDRVYGNRDGLNRHLLHAWKLAFRHPWNQRGLQICAPPPEDFVKPEIETPSK